MMTICKAMVFLTVALVWLSGVPNGTCQEGKETAVSRGTDTASLISSMDVLNGIHKLASGDQLSFRVIEDEDPPRRLIVTDSGEMEVPHIGRLKAAGKSCKALAYEIKTSLEKEYYYQATVILGLDVISNRPVSLGKVYVMGQVRSQGPQEIPANESFTVSKAVMRAGGFAEYANRRKVKLVRRSAKGGPTETKIVDLVEVMEKGKTDGDLAVEPEDLIIVPERLINF